MSWQASSPWPQGTPLPGIVGNPAIHSTVLPSVVNPTPGILPPQAAAAAAPPVAMPASMQYSPEQWAQMQQQNWQQWAQWQQQYQQWHQQYGAEYQKSMNALQTPTPNTSVPPPPPNENKPPPPPPPEETQSQNYSRPPPIGYTTAPPPSHPPQYGQGGGDWQSSAPGKRPSYDNDQYGANKRQMLDNRGGNNSWQAQPQQQQQQPPPVNVAAAAPPPQKSANLEELSEAEKKFDKEFAAWEAQFNKWKDQNANHPDKSQYIEYEKKWESWRNSLLERREQMRKKRVALQATLNPSKPPPTNVPPPQHASNVPPSQHPSNLPPSQHPSRQQQQSGFAQGEVSKPNTSAQPPFAAKAETFPENFYSKPPPTQNNEPLAFKPTAKAYSSVPVADNNEAAGGGDDFLKSSSPAPGGIPGLDLVKEGEAEHKVEDNPDECEFIQKNQPPPSQGASKGPDLDAISKGINSILGDPKLLNMLSMVSQNQTAGVAAPVITQAPVNAQAPVNTPPNILQIPPGPPPLVQNRIQPGIPSLLNLPLARPNLQEMLPKRQSFERPDYDEYSQPSCKSGQSEAVNNFDDQTRMSFSNGPNEQETGYGNTMRGDNRNDSFRRFQDNNRNGGFGGNDWRNNSFGGSNNSPSNFRNSNGQGFSRDNNMPFNRDSNMPLNRDNDGPFNRSKGAPFNRDHDEQFSRDNDGPFNRDHDDPMNRDNDDPYSRDNDGSYNRDDDGPYDHDQDGPYDRDNDGPYNRDNDGPFSRDNDGPYNRGQDGPYNPDNGGPYNRDNHDPYNDGPFNRNNGGPPFNRDNRGPPFNRDNDAPFSRNNRGQFTRENNAPFNRNNSGRFDRSDSFNRDESYCDSYGEMSNERFNDREQYDDVQQCNEPYNEEDDFDKYHDMFNEDPQHSQGREQGVGHFAQASPPAVEEQVAPVPEPEPVPEPVEEEPLFVPQVVVDYEHKSSKEPQPEVALDVIRMFDYRHKPVNRIPYPQRPIWLSSCLRNIKQFDPLGTTRFAGNELSFDREATRYSMKPEYEPSRFIERDPKYINELPRNRYESDLPTDRYSNNRHPDPKLADRGDFDRNRGRPDSDFTRNRVRDDFDRNRGRDDFDRNRGRSSETDRKSKSGGFDKQGDRASKRSGHSQEKDVAPKKLELEELSDDEDFGDAKNNAAKAGLRFSPPPKKPSENNNADVQFVPLSNPVNNKPIVQSVTIEDLICSPGRLNRPQRIVIILRGPPGSGKTHLAKLMKDKEVENGGSAPRILSLDDYFMVEHEKEIMEDGKRLKVKEMTYEYEAEMEESYRQSLIKSFKKTITDGYFPFVIVDNVNQKVKNFGEMWSFAKQNGFQVYICQLDLDPVLCISRNIHHRNESFIEECIAGWEPTPAHHPLVDATNFLQSQSITEVEMELDSEEPEEIKDVDQERVSSKWDTFDCSLNNLARLDGVNKPLRHSTTMAEYLQLDDEWKEPTKPTKPGQKRVRWADLEEQKQQTKMKALGFVVGHTDWDRMMDTTMGQGALTQTKYIESRYK